MQRYYGLFSNALEIARDFEINFSEYDAREEFPQDEDILFASYEYESYSGDAFVLFRRKVWNAETKQREEKLFEVHGGHCSCYGLEDQWVPEETSWEALAMRKPDYGVQDNDALRALIKQHAPS